MEGNFVIRTGYDVGEKCRHFYIIRRLANSAVYDYGGHISVNIENGRIVCTGNNKRAMEALEYRIKNEFWTNLHDCYD